MGVGKGQVILFKTLKSNLHKINATCTCICSPGSEKGKQVQQRLFEFHDQIYYGETDEREQVNMMRRRKIYNT